MRTAEWNTTLSVLERADRILSAFHFEDKTLGISELARRTSLPKSTVARLTSELVKLRYLERQGVSYRLGLALFELGQLAATPKELRRGAIAVMADLRNATGQTIHLAVLDGTDVVYIEILRGRATLKMPSRVGGRLPAHASAVGKAMLAFSPPQIIDRVIDRGLPPVGPRTIIDKREFRKEIARIKARGVAFENQESSVASACAASPVINFGGTVVAGLSISGQVGLLDAGLVGPAVRTAALTLGRQLLGNETLPFSEL